MDFDELLVSKGMTNKPLYTIQEAAVLLAARTLTIRRWCSQHVLEGVKKVRNYIAVTRRNLQAFVMGGRNIQTVFPVQRQPPREGAPTHQIGAAAR